MIRNSSKSSNRSFNSRIGSGTLANNVRPSSRNSNSSFNSGIGGVGFSARSNIMNTSSANTTKKINRVDSATRRNLGMMYDAKQAMSGQKNATQVN